MRKSKTTAVDFEAALAEEMARMEADRLEKMRRRAEEILARRGIYSPEEEERRRRHREVVRQSSRSMGLSYVDEAPEPWPSLPILNRPSNSDLRVKPIYGLTAEGVTITQRGTTHLMASPIIRGDKAEVWAYVPAPDGKPGWTLVDVPIPRRPAEEQAFFAGLREAGVTFGTGSFRRGEMQPTPAWSYLSTWILDGLVRHLG